MTLDQAIDSMCCSSGSGPILLDDIEIGSDTIAAIERMGSLLAQETSEARRNVLVDLVNQYIPGSRWIRDPRIVAALLRGGCARSDAAAEDALQCLVYKATPQALSGFHPEILRMATAKPTPKALLLVARAKPSGALAALKAVAVATPAAKDLVEWKIAMAAAGDRGRVKAFAQAFVNATDPREKQRLAGILGSIGTRPALTVLAEGFRTPLVYRLDRVLQEPVWVDIANALQANFPERELPMAPSTEQDYLVYEAFCEKEFGIRWWSDRPPFESPGPLEHGFSPAPE